MAVKVKIPDVAVRITAKKALIGAGIFCGVALVLGVMVFTFYWSKYGKIVDDRLKHPLFTETAKIYAAPPEIRPGQKLSPKTISQELQQAGYSLDGDGAASPMGTFVANARAVTIHPGPQSYHSQDGATISFSDNAVSEITGDNGQQLAAYELEPMLVTGLSDENRAKRRLVTYDELPKYLVPAVTAIEDRHFFQHGGVDYFRLAGAVVDDLRSHHYSQGGSTLTMQLARGFFLTPEKHIKRKMIEIVITFQLEHRFTKQQIFQMYANQVPLGQRGSFSIDGFGEAAQAYFGKDVRQLDLPECALLAGIIQSPSRLNPFRHPERALERRNVVLDAMVETGDITKTQAEQAKAAPLQLEPGAFDAGEAPYFVDLVRDQLIQRLGDNEYNQQGLRIYTSLDPQLQQIAQDAVAAGMKHVDELVQARREHLLRTALKAGTTPPPAESPQVALIALNPHTGQVLALVGGRNYGISQFNHAVSHRPTGSIFKPFVYAAAFNTAIAGTPLTNPDGTSSVFTPVTLLHDAQTTFTFDNQDYTPRDFDNKYYGDITATEALYRSLNNPTIALAQMVGFENVAALARDAGVKSARGTPAMAIGAYDATPLDMAGAYTVFANEGIHIDPWMLASVRAPNGDVVADYQPQTKPVLDPRAAFLTVSMMEQVLNNPHGTGAGVRNMGFTSPAAGKTGTSHDAWYAGFTSNLLCIVWIGNDDYTDIKTELGANAEGARAAGPIFADFMKNAVKLPQYSDTKDFVPPAGVVQVRLDDTTSLLANATCPEDYTAAFLDGTQPTDTCDHSMGDQRNLFQKIFGLGQRPAASPPPPVQAARPAPPPTQVTIPQPSVAQTQPGDQQNQDDKKKKKPGFWGRLFGKKDDTQQQPQTQPQ
ncbi:MAG TPA: transglycosylase domain-containing protein [Acidobacteriaceae bacterium]|jgi:penicillin-binding protein 1B|nr:transglycosylase domain-containing protein [Acidobacteriaceae bacterium]